MVERLQCVTAEPLMQGEGGSVNKVKLTSSWIVKISE